MPIPCIQHDKLRTWTLLGVLLTGCYSHESYVLSQAQVEQLSRPELQSDPEAQAIRAVRTSDHKSVWVKSEALRPALSALAPQALGANAQAPLGAVSIPVRAYNPKITAGAALTWIGTGISLVGTVLVAVGKVQDNSPLFYAGAISALAAEPLMWTGTGLWIAGALRPPFETSTPRPEK